MTDLDIIKEIRWSIDHSTRPEFSVRLPRSAWSSVVWHVERSQGETPEKAEALEALSNLRRVSVKLERVQRENAGLLEEIEKLRAKNQEYIERHASDYRQLMELRQAVDGIRRKRRRPTIADALAAGLRADGGEDPAALAREYGWVSAATMASAIVKARSG